MLSLPEIHGCRDLLRHFMILHRLAINVPFKVTTNNNRTTFMAQKPGLINSGQIAVAFLIILYAQYRKLITLNQEDVVSFIGIIVLHTIVMAVALISALIVLYKHKYVLNALEILTTAEEEMRYIGINISYKFWFKVSCLYVSNLMFLPMLFLTKKENYTILLDLVGMYYPIMIRYGILGVPLFAVCILRERFKKLNKKLNELELDTDVNNELEWNAPIFILKEAKNIHANLVEVAVTVNKCYSIIILINIITNITHDVLTMLIMYNGNYTDITFIELLIALFAYNAQMCAIYLFSFLSENEATDTLVLLGQLNICYLNPKMALVKNTFLLQGLHSKMNFNVCGMFPLNLNICLKQFSICRTMFLLLLQYYKKSV